MSFTIGFIIFYVLLQQKQHNIDYERIIVLGFKDFMKGKYLIYFFFEKYFTVVCTIILLLSLIYRNHLNASFEILK